MLTKINPQSVLQRAFPGIPASEANELIAASRIDRFAAGKIICREKALETTFYILLNGEVRVTKWINDREERVMKHLGPGDFFGEMAIIHNAPRAATVTAVKPCTALELRKEDFTRLLEHSSSMSLAIVREVSRRLRENDEMAIDDLRAKAKELANAYEQLADVDHARREFLTSIAHELRTPLMAANGFLQVIRLGSLQGEDLKDALDTIARNLKDITSLTNDILFLQEMDLILPEFTPVNLDNLTTSVFKQFRIRAGQNKIELRLQVAHGIPPISGDARSLQRAIAAILDNAIKFSPEGGEVAVTVTCTSQTVMITVQDHGVGISPEVLPHIFDRFFHVEKIDGHLFGGLGLGLSIAKQVIDLHQGSIQVESEPGAGSKFTIQLEINAEE
jgi:signal transduction histidine kinase